MHIFGFFTFMSFYGSANLGVKKTTSLSLGYFFNSCSSGKPRTPKAKTKTEHFKMAIYHMSVKPVQRSKGRSSTAAAAYRAACKIEDKRTGLEHDYTKKAGVKHTEIITPLGVNIPTRSELWNAAEAAEKRKDGCTAREYEVNLPYELSEQQRTELAQDFCKQLAEIHGIAVDLCIHEPTDKEVKAGADARNHHAHILTTTRKITNNGLTDKADIEKSGRKRKDDLKATRELWSATANKHLKKAGLDERIDERSLKDQGSSLKPTIKLGKVATQMEREPLNTKAYQTPRPKYQTRKGDINRAIRADNERIKTLEAEIANTKALLEKEAKLIKTDAPLVKIGAFANTLFIGLHKEHDDILNFDKDKQAQRIKDTRDNFLMMTDKLTDILDKDLDSSKLSADELSDVKTALESVFKLTSNVDNAASFSDYNSARASQESLSAIQDSYSKCQQQIERIEQPQAVAESSQVMRPR